MKIMIYLLVVFILAVVITPVFAELDLSNQKIVSDNDKLVLQFTGNAIRYGLTQIYITPQLEHGTVDLGNVELTLDDARVNIMASSFTVKNDYITMYAKSLGEGKFRINVYIFTDSGLQKNTFTASIVTNLN